MMYDVADEIRRADAIYFLGQTPRIEMSKEKREPIKSRWSKKAGRRLQAGIHLRCCRGT